MAETIFAYAVEKGIDIAPRKTSIVASLVRDRYVADAVVILEHTHRKAARPVRKAIESPVRKAIESARANLINNSVESIDPKTIRIARISVTAGKRLRRYKPASRGRALPFEKISSNIFVEVAGEVKAKPAKAAKTAEAKPAQSAQKAQKGDK